MIVGNAKICISDNPVFSNHLNRLKMPDKMAFPASSEHITCSSLTDKINPVMCGWKNIFLDHARRYCDTAIKFLSPAISYLFSENSNSGKWKTPGPWK